MSASLALIAATMTHAEQQRLIILLVIGFAIAVFGHLISSRPVIAVGAAIFFAASFVLPLLLYR